jgi:amidophosphoribosyltransferase
VEKTVLGFIPNTAETAYMGMIEGFRNFANQNSADRIWEHFEAGTLTRETLERTLAKRARAEKVTQKDQRLRTFITHDSARKSLVGHIYDITCGTVRPEDTLVVIDDSIVRGTTLRESIITMLARLNPRKIVIASSAPPIKYPDCYGIDMSQLGRFIAFEAAVSLIKDQGDLELLEEVERKCLEQEQQPDRQLENHVKLIYKPFAHEVISNKIAELLRSPTLEWDGELDLVYQDIAGLRDAMPEHTGDWYFTGDYPTPGGNRVVNTAYLKWRRNDSSRSY